MVSHQHGYQLLLECIKGPFWDVSLDLSNNLSSTVKLFTDDTSLFSFVNDVNLSEFHLNSDLKKISDWAYQ